MKTKTSIKVGGVNLANHNQKQLRIKTGVKAGVERGGIFFNHNQKHLRIKPGRPGKPVMNHNVRSLRIQTGAKAGIETSGILVNHNMRQLRVKTAIKAGSIVDVEREGSPPQLR